MKSPNALAINPNANKIYVASQEISLEVDFNSNLQ